MYNPVTGRFFLAFHALPGSVTKVRSGAKAPQVVGRPDPARPFRVYLPECFRYRMKGGHLKAISTSFT